MKQRYLGEGGRILLILTLKKEYGTACVGSNSLRIEKSAGFFEHGNEHSDPIKYAVKLLVSEDLLGSQYTL